MSLHVIDGRPVTDGEWLRAMREIEDDVTPPEAFRPSDCFIGCPEEFDLTERRDWPDEPYSDEARVEAYRREDRDRCERETSRPR